MHLLHTNFWWITFHIRCILTQGVYLRTRTTQCGRYFESYPIAVTVSVNITSLLYYSHKTLNAQSLYSGHYSLL